MSFSSLFHNTHDLKGNIAIVNAVNESSVQVIQDVLAQTNATFTLYNTQDVSELIRSFELPASMLKRIHIHTFDETHEALAACLKDLDNHKVDVLMKGLIPTNQILSAVLRHLRLTNGKQYFLNHIACCDIPQYHKLLFISDVALNIHPTIEEHQKMIKNIAQFTKQLGYTSLKVALLSSVESVSDKIPSSVQANQLKQFYKQQDDKHNVIVDGPFALDNAIDKQSAMLKGITSPVAGDADVIIVPQLDVGNALYKSLTYFGHAKVASLMIGTPYPIVLTSRADSVANKTKSVLLALKTLA
ncbi:phosphate butyryltransferase [Staphylococcus hyicus]|uniref:Phosphate butyryltransferase n=1 Tax=Staphylococcus hyicus TaxID=1284 RepID=A0A418JHI1_STAHY|nr:phosphate acyltransferase [Staphylococcus hyicus]NJH82198.1 phosphate butyryltransferase [Staphylococcus hyicus]RIO44574.1 phosphate butyryltransferase [Staphylococcus hyicus]